MNDFFQRVKYKKCEDAVRKAMDKMDDCFDRLRNSATLFVHKEWDRHQKKTEGFDI